MAIIKMNKISLLGLEQEKEPILEALMKIGAVEVSSTKVDEFNEDIDDFITQDGQEEEVQSIEEEIEKVKSAIEYFVPYDKRKKGLLASKRNMDAKAYSKFLENLAQLRDIVNQIYSLDAQLNQSKNKKNKLRNEIGALQPWRSLELEVDRKGTKYASYGLGVFPANIDILKVQEEIENDGIPGQLEVINQDRDQIYVFFFCYRSSVHDLMKIIRKHSFEVVRFKGLEGTITHNISNLTSQIENLEEDIKETENKITEFSKKLEDLEVYYDHLLVEKEKKAVLANLVKTNRVFILKGWLPEAISNKVKEDISKKWNCVIDIQEPSEDDDMPILLTNSDLAQSAEPVTEMYSLPNAKEIDPNIFMAPFYALFFGLMLSDAGYGVVMSLFTMFIIKKYNPPKNTRKFLKLMFYSGLATIFWGALFGSWFGDAAYYLTGGRYEIKPLAFNPLDDPERLLIWALVLGIVHMFVGIAIRGINLAREKKYIDILFDVVFWYVFFIGAILFVMPYVPGLDEEFAQQNVGLGLNLLGIGAVLLILTQGRKHKNIFAKLVMGVASLYDLVSFMSDTLSYSRLLALGLATGVIATIINDMGSMGGNNILGYVIFLIVFLAGHTFNFLMNSLGAYVHASRLQYIEFFGKFYKGGGKTFTPFKINTKYINFNNEEEI